jgi:hypothetical protein
VSARWREGLLVIETAARQPCPILPRTETPAPTSEGPPMKRRLTLVSALSALMVLAAQPAFAGITNLGS